MQTVHRTLREKQREEREQLILQVAEEVLLEKGYYETSMEEIATRVGIAKGTVYLHFPSKDDMVVAIFERDMQSFLLGFDTAVASKLTERAKLESLLQFMYTGFYSKRALLLSIIFNSVDLRRIFAEKKGCMRDLWGQLADRVSAILLAGQAAGEFDAALPISVMRSTFFSLLSPLNYGRLIVEEHIPAEELVKYIVRIYFNGVAAHQTAD